MRPAWEPIPDQHVPPLADHPFEPYQLGGMVICIHLDGTRPCGRSEDEHAPASEEAEAGA